MTFPSKSAIVAARFDEKTLNMMDDARLNKQTMVESRSSLLKTSVYFYLSYMGYEPPKPASGVRRK